MYVKDGIPSAKYSIWNNILVTFGPLGPMMMLLHVFGINVCGVNGTAIHSLLRERVGLN